MLLVGKIQEDNAILVLRCDVGEDVVNECAMRVQKTKTPARGNVLEHQVEQKRALARSRLAKRQEMARTIFFTDRDGLPVWCLAKKNRLHLSLPR